MLGQQETVQPLRMLYVLESGSSEEVWSATRGQVTRQVAMVTRLSWHQQSVCLQCKT